MERTEEEFSVEMYYNYGVAEWHEKSIVLLEDEKNRVLDDLAKGMNTFLVELVRLPFPRFVCTYLENEPGAAKYLKDPGFGYKLYFLSDGQINYVVNAIRGNKTIRGYKKKETGPTWTEVQEILKIKLDNIPRIASSLKNRILFEQKFLYLSQYIDYEEAKKLGLDITSRLERDANYTGVLSDGFRLYEKLELLNPISRYIMARFLGLCGHTRAHFVEIARELGVPSDIIKNLIREISPCLMSTYGDFKNKLGYVEKGETSTSFSDYTNKKFREMDIIIHEYFVYHNMLSSSEKEVLYELSRVQRNSVYAYIAYKYLFGMNEKRTVERVSSTKDEIERINERVISLL